MTLRITIDIFSGRPNPNFVIDGYGERELLRRLAAPAAKGRSRVARVPPSLLGYRGIIVERLADDQRRKGRAAAPKTAGRLPAVFRIAGGSIHSRAVTRPIADTFVEDFICGSTGPIRLAGLGSRFPDYCLEEIARFRHILDRYSWGRIRWPIKPVCTCAPLWEPNWWNDAGQIQWNNNCYNYGTNYRTDTFAQPGLANGAMYATISCADVRAGAVADALIDSPGANNKCPKEGHLVALVVGPNWDFHWYRKGRNGYWTHKPGGTQATDRDNSGNPIRDPRTADRGGYTSFCTFMVVMHGHVKIR